MGQQEYNAFKEQMKQWMLENADAYDRFEEMMNVKSNEGYRTIFKEAMSIVPKYKKIISKKINNNSLDNISDIENVCIDDKLGEKIISQFDKQNKETLIPSMICWLYYGRSFENMIERGEDIMKNPKINKFQSFLIARASKMLIKKSISLGMRTKDDWDEYYKLREIIDSGNVLKWALSDLPDEKEYNHIERVSALESMIILDKEKKEILLNKMGEYINTGVKGKSIALMILALRQLGYMPDTVPDKKLFTALRTYFNTYIGSDKSIYAYLEHGVAKQFNDEIATLIAFFKLE